MKEKEIMMQDFMLVEQRFKRFIETVCTSGVVYALERDDGYAMSEANEYENSMGEPLDVICYWSEKAMAGSCISEEWIEYRVVEISLPEFIESWCIGMAGDNVVAGINFDVDMFGYEIDPYELVLALGAQLRKQRRRIKLSKYEEVQMLCRKIEKIVSSQPLY